MGVTMIRISAYFPNYIGPILIKNRYTEMASVICLSGQP